MRGSHGHKSKLLLAQVKSVGMTEGLERESNKLSAEACIGINKLRRTVLSKCPSKQSKTTPDRKAKGGLKNRGRVRADHPAARILLAKRLSRANAQARRDLASNSQGCQPHLLAQSHSEIVLATPNPLRKPASLPASFPVSLPVF